MAAVHFDGGSVDDYSGDVTGFRFTIGQSDVMLTHLGIFDVDSDGLGESHDVGIYEVQSMTLMASATLPAGSSAMLSDGFRYVEVTPVDLLAGQTYVALAYRQTGVDGIVANVDNLTFATWMTYDTEVAANDFSGLSFVNTPFGADNGWFGPGFQGRVAP